MNELERFLKEANCGIVGIDAALKISGGYDNPLPQADIGPPDDVWGDEEERLSPSTKVALSDYMIDRWNRYKSGALQEQAGDKLITGAGAAPLRASLQEFVDGKPRLGR